jgi:uncharacterized protein YjbI with pentapeptide repeats
MSNVFITDIVGTGDFAVPANDTALATATTELEALIGDLSGTLSYKRLLAWVEDWGGPDGAEGVRSLNCLIEQFEYNSEECPDSTETATLTAAIESTLEGDPDITSIGPQQVALTIRGEYYYWDRNTSSGFLYLEDATDDVGVGGSTPNGKWFQDGDLVLGGNTMSGTERLRVIGDQRIEGGVLMTEQSAVPFAPGAGEGTYWIDDGDASPNVPCFTDDAGTDHRLAFVDDLTSLYGIDQVLFVDKTGGVYVADGTIQKPYNSINNAISAANALTPGVSNRIGIIVYPGIYAEAVITQDDYVSLIGLDRDSTRIVPGGITSPLDVRHVNIAFRNMTFETQAGNTDYIVDEGSVTQGDVEFANCRFLGTNGSANNFFRARFKGFTFYDCEFEQDSTNLVVFQSEQSTDTDNYFHKCQFRGVTQIWASGQINNYFYGCKFTSTANSGAYYGTIRFNAGNPESFFYGCYIENTDINGYPIWINTLITDMADFHGCQFQSASSYDIAGQNYGTIGVYGCTMSQGMYRYARTRNLLKYCNGAPGDKDYYTDIDECMRSLDSTDDGCTVKFLGNYTSANQVSNSSLGLDMTIDGQDYTWTDTGPTSGFTIVCQAGVTWLKNLNFVDATVTCQGAGTKMFLDNCDIQGVVYQRGVGDDPDTLTVIHDCKVVGIAGGPSVGYPLSINDVDPTIIVSKSYLKGYTGYAAVNFNLRDNDNLKIEYSQIFHASLGTNNPFTGVGAFVINYRAHHTTFNQEPALAAPSDYVNDIDSGQRHNIIDPDGDFAVMDGPF